MSFPSAYLEIKIVLSIMFRGSIFIEWVWARSEFCCEDSSFTRVSMAIPFTFQVFPPSSENASSKRHESRDDIRYDRSKKHGATFQLFLEHEFAASILKLADHGLEEGAVLAGGKIIAPLVSLGIVKTQV